VWETGLAAQTAGNGGWTAAAKSDGPRNPPAPAQRAQGIVVIVNDDAITAYEIEQRARLIALSSNIGQQAKEQFQRLVKSESTEQAMRKLQEDVIRWRAPAHRSCPSSRLKPRRS
jgi:hypothetical protein